MNNEKEKRKAKKIINMREEGDAGNLEGFIGRKKHGKKWVGDTI